MPKDSFTDHSFACLPVAGLHALGQEQRDCGGEPEAAQPAVMSKARMCILLTPQVVGIVTVICAALYPTVVSPTLTASQHKHVSRYCVSGPDYAPLRSQHLQESRSDRAEAQAGFVKKGRETCLPGIEKVQCIQSGRADGYVVSVAGMWTEMQHKPSKPV